MRLLLLFLLVSTSSFSLAQPIDRWVIVHENMNEEIALNAETTEPDVYYTHSMVLSEMRHNFKTGLLAGHTEYTFALFDCEHPRLQEANTGLIGMGCVTTMGQRHIGSP